MLGKVPELTDDHGVGVEDQEDEGETGGALDVLPVSSVPRPRPPPDQPHRSEDPGGRERSEQCWSDENESERDDPVNIIQRLSDLTGLGWGLAHHLLAHHPVEGGHGPDEDEKPPVQVLDASSGLVLLRPDNIFD